MCDTIAKFLPDGTGLFAKNSDRSPNEPQVLEWYPSMVHEEPMVKATYIEVEQVKETKAFLLSRPIWLWGGEMGINECGVCIGNEAVFTKGAYGKSGLTGMDLVRLALERSENAKQALECIISLLETYGQGGNCGYDHDFFYDNGFLIMDRDEIYVLETAGKKWVYKKTDCVAISNRLSIGTEGDKYSDGPCDFAKKYTEPVYTFFSQSKNRRRLCQESVNKAACLQDMFAALRQHEDETEPLCKAGVGSPCMHYGGMVGDHTTQSMAVEYRADGQIYVWITGRSLPCVSLFKPLLLGNALVSPVFAAEDPRAKEYWLEAETFNRQLLGHILPKAYYEEKDGLEERWLLLSQKADAHKMQELSVLALEEERAFVEKWKQTQLEKGKVSSTFKKNWEKKNKNLR